MENPTLPQLSNAPAAPDSLPETSNLPERSHALTRGAHRLFNIPGDECNQATEKLLPIQRDTIRWLHAYAWNNNIHQDDLGAMIRRPNGKTYDGHTLYRIFKGIHGAKLDSFVEAAAAFRKVIESQSAVTRADFVETRLGDRIFKICDSAKRYRTIECMYGESQIGKTENLEEYARRNNHGMTVLWRIPTGGSLTRSAQELAMACRVSSQLKLSEILHRVVRFFTPQMLLIVDEAHQCLLQGTSGKTTIEFIREIHERTKCGVVISATPIFNEEMQKGKMRELMRQLDLRSLGPNFLPNKPDERDLNAFAAHYGLPPAKTDPKAHALQTEVAEHERLGRWLKRLMAGSYIASKRGVKMKWEHVINADSAIRKKALPTLD